MSLSKCVYVYISFFDQLMESPVKHIFIPKWLLVKFFTFALCSFIMPLDFMESLSILLQREVYVYYPDCAQKENNKKLLNRLLQISQSVYHCVEE